MSNEKSCCIVDSWFSSPRRMGLAALVCSILAIFSILIHNLLSAIFGEQSFVSGITMIMAFVFLSGFAVALAVFLILQLEQRVRDIFLRPCQSPPPPEPPLASES